MIHNWILSPLINLSTIITIITSFLLARKVISINPQFSACNPTTCGDNLSITFPFYIEGKQESFCGYPGFNLSCHNGHSILILQGITYIIHQISYENQTIRVSNTAVFDTANTCIPPYQNTSYSEKFELYSNQTEIVFLYHCNSSRIGGLMNYKVNCSSDSANNSTLSMFKDDPLLETAASVCEDAVVAAVDVEIGSENNRTEMELMVQRGFVLRWIASNCNVCHLSGGKCGFNFDTVHFNCFCPDRPHAKHCVPPSKLP
ncbi:Protein kinase superfamily protein [Euphorbia peplus]|nr:Protein kinase superfamily protein [Euphorbia peplus]